MAGNSSFYEFVLNLKDNLSKGMKNASKNVADSNRNMQKSFNKTRASAKNMFSDISQAASNFSTRIKTSLGFGSGGIFSQLIPLGGAAAVTSLFRVGIDQAQQLSTNLVRIQAQIAPLMRDAKDDRDPAKLARSYVDKINAMKTKFDPARMQSVAGTLLSGGVGYKELIPTLKRVSDIASGTGADITQLGIAYSQIMQAGQLKGQELYQLINANVPILSALSKQLGVSTGQIKDMMKAGEISSGMVRDAFITMTSEGGAYHNMNEKIVEQMGGALPYAINQMKLAWGEFTLMFEGAFVSIGEILGGVANWIKDNKVWLSQLVGILVKVGAAILGITIAWKAWKIAVSAFGWAKFLIQYMGLMIVELWGSVAAAYASAGGFSALAASIWAVLWPVALVAAAIAAFVYLLYKAYKNWESWGRAAVFVMALFNPLMLIVGVLMEIINAWDYIAEGFQKDGIIEGIKRIGLAIMNFVYEPIADTINGISKLFGGGKLVPNSLLPSKTAKGVSNAAKGARAVAKSVKPAEGSTDEETNELTSGVDQSNKATVNGGRKVTNINISFENLVETLNIVSDNLDEGAQEAKEKLSMYLLQVLNSGNSVV